MGTQAAALLAAEQKLAADVAANTTAINGLIIQDTATIADLNAQIAVLKAADPTLDLTSLEASITALEANNAALAAATTPAPVPAV